MRALYVRANRPSRLRKALAMTVLFLLWTPLAAIGAEYQGRKVDGLRYRSFVHSLVTCKYYPASVVFEQNLATVHLASGKTLELTLDEEAIDDPEEVVAIDPSGQWWAISIDGLDEVPDGTETAISSDGAPPPRF